MATRLFGVETEYALAAFSPDGLRFNQNKFLEDLVKRARKSLPSLPDARSPGMFLGNGSRFYVDCGCHPEVSTPECSNPWEAVRYIQAGDSMLTTLAEDFLNNPSPGLPIKDVQIWKGNVDYSGTGATWGCHESYLHKANLSDLANNLIPFLVSRLVYTGSGGFDSRSAGLVFMLSPRVAHLERVISDESTHDRGIFHTKNESLSRGFHRLHLLCGESLLSEKATWLKLGTTALVVALIEAGVQPAMGVELEAPLDAMRQFADDHTCRAATDSQSGVPVTALSIQRHYLEQVENYLDQQFMPPWGPDVCREWRKILEELEDAPASIATTLDWGIKFALYQDRARQCEIPWETLSSWSLVVDKLSRDLPRDREGAIPKMLSPALDTIGPIAKSKLKFTPILNELKLRWEDLPKFLALRNELFEIDTRFGQLGNEGIFAALDRAQILSHHMPGVRQVEDPVLTPPPMGRANLRGKCISRMAKNGGPFFCDWTEIWDIEKKQKLDLHNPFEKEERWYPLSGQEAREAELGDLDFLSPRRSFLRRR